MEFKSDKEFKDYLKICPYLKLCKFFKGETKCPYNEGDKRRKYWILEQNVLYLHPTSLEDFKESIEIFFERFNLNYEEL